MDREDSSAIVKGTVVRIDGLASEKGKALNGGYGLVSGKANVDGSGNKRHPVLIFSKRVNGTDEIIQTQAIKNSLKESNLQAVEDQKHKLFKDGVIAQFNYAAKTRTNESNGHHSNLIWYEEYCNRWPDGDGHLEVNLAFVEMLQYGGRLGLGVSNPRLALQVFDGFIDQMDSNYPNCDLRLCLYAEICCAAGASDHIEEALEAILKFSTTETNELTRKVVLQTLNDILTFSSKQNEEDPTMKHPAMFEVQVRAAQRIYELKPHVSGCVLNLGAAYCLKGDCMNGVKWYRHAMSLQDYKDNLDEGKKKYYLKSLITAQLQCPGMPLEDYIILYDDGQTLTCIKKDQRHLYHIGRRITGFGRQTGTFHAHGGEVDAMKYPLPTDPDDPEHFPQSFVDSFIMAEK